MPRKKTQTAGVDPELKRAVKDLLKFNDKTGFDEKCKAIDRALKLAAIEAKMGLDEGYGTGFTDMGE